MSAFQDQITADLAVFVNPDEFGSPAVYTPVLNDPDISEPVSCNIIIDHDVALQPESYDAVVVETGTTVEALFSDVATPQKGSTFTADGNVYTVQRITDNDQTFVKMVVTEEADW